MLSFEKEYNSMYFKCLIILCVNLYLLVRLNLKLHVRHCYQSYNNYSDKSYVKRTVRNESNPMIVSMQVKVRSQQIEVYNSLNSSSFCTTNSMGFSGLVMVFILYCMSKTHLLEFCRLQLIYIYIKNTPPIIL